MSKVLVATGRGNGGAGGMACPGAAVGDRVIGLMWQSPRGEILKVPATYVEAVVTVADQLQTPYPLLDTVSYPGTGGAAVFTDILGVASSAPPGLTNRFPAYANGNFIVFLEESAVASADGAISVKDGVVYVTKASAAALTLADPASVTDDGKKLSIISTTAAAHTVSNAAGSGFNAGGAASDVGTFGAAKGNNLILRAYGGKWLVESSVGVTLA